MLSPSGKYRNLVTCFERSLNHACTTNIQKLMKFFNKESSSFAKRFYLCAVQLLRKLLIKLILIIARRTLPSK